MAALFFSLLLILIPLQILSAQPCNLTVTNSNDSGPGSLCQALAGVCDGGTITFNLSIPATITLTGGALQTGSRSVTIQGPGESQLFISGSNSSRVFDLESDNSNDSVTIKDLTVQDGSTSGDGAGICFRTGTLRLENVTITNNIAADSGGGIYLYNATGVGNNVTVSENTGEGIDNFGSTLTLTNSGIFSNTYDGITNRNSVENNATITLTNVTSSGNYSGFYSRRAATATLEHVTITRNDYGIDIEDNSGTVSIQNSLIANNNLADIYLSSGGDPTDLHSLGYNIIGNLLWFNFSTNTTAVQVINTASVSSDQLSATPSDGATVRIKPSDSDGDGIADDYDSAPNDPDLPTTYASRVYLTSTDNENNAGTGEPDNDLGNSVSAIESNHPIEFNIWLDEALPRKNALLAVYSSDVDWPAELNEVYLNGQKLGEMIGLDGLRNSTLFVVPDTSLLKLGDNLVQLEVNTNAANQGVWSTTVFYGQLVTDFSGSAVGDATILSLDMPLVADYGETITITLEANTVRATQDVRLELVLRNAMGTAVNFDDSSAARVKTLTGSGERHQWIVTLPAAPDSSAAATSGIWTLTTAIYDITTSELSDYEAQTLAVPDASSGQPALTSITPSAGVLPLLLIMAGAVVVTAVLIGRTTRRRSSTTS